MAARYANEHGIGLGEARWYNVHPQRFANGRPNVTEYRPNDQSWKFETSLPLARAILRQFGLDPESLPLDL